MEKNNFMIRKLKNILSGYDGLILYGAGYAAKNLIEILEEEDIVPSYCVVTSLAGNPKKIGILNVYSFEQKVKELLKKNILVIVAVSGSHEKKIMDLLNQAGIKNKVPLSEFWCNFSLFREMYLEKSFEWYLDRVKDWYYEHNGFTLENSILQNNKEERMSRVIFVLNHPSPRAVKIIRALKNNGKQITVLLNENLVDDEAYSLWCNYLREICTCHYYSEIEQLIFLLLKHKGMVVHVFSTPWNIYIPYLLVKMQSHIGKIVFDEYDIANGFYVGMDKNILQLERYCLENANGICYREFSLEYLTDSLKFNIKGKTIRFFDYCFGDEQNNVVDKTGELSMCYVGGLVRPESPAFLSLDFIEMCEQSKCHLHVYPLKRDEIQYREYLEKEKESKYFHVHKPIAYEKLIYELSQYDYGVMPTRDDIWDMEGDTFNTKYKYIYAACNKFFDYIDAALPIIAACPLKMIEYLEDMGVLIPWTNGQYNFDFLMTERKNMKRKVIEAREILRIENHVGKLIEFYESL